MTIYTYIGGGDSPPQVTNFMGKQEFIIGEPVDVTNPELLKKLEGNPCFTMGKVEMRKIIKATEEAKVKASNKSAEGKARAKNVVAARMK